MKSELELLSLYIFNSTDYLVSFFNDCNGSRQKEWTKRSVESVHDFILFFKRKRTVLSGKNTKQKTRSHKTQKENDNLYMIPNQRQR